MLVGDPCLPYVRAACRLRFNIADFTDATVDDLKDWLCTNYNLTPQAVEQMNLKDVADKLAGK